MRMMEDEGQQVRTVVDEGQRVRMMNDEGQQVRTIVDTHTRFLCLLNVLCRMTQMSSEYEKIT